MTEKQSFHAMFRYAGRVETISENKVLFSFMKSLHVGDPSFLLYVLYIKNSNRNTMMKTLKMELEPTGIQRNTLDAHIDGLRYVYNAIITACKITYRNTGELPSKFDLYNLCTRFRNNVPFVKELHSTAVQYTVDCALQACRACLEYNIKKRKDSANDTDDSSSDVQAIGASHFPRYRKRGQIDTYGFLSNKYFDLVYEMNANGKMKRRLKLGKVKGTIRCYNQRTKLDGIPKTIRITRKDMGTHYRYFASISYEAVCRGDIHIGRPERTVGVDVGISNMAALSDGTIFPNDRIYSRKEKEIQRLGRRLSSAKSTPDVPKQKKIINHINHLYERIHNIRRNSIETISRDIVDNYDNICMEDLSVKGLKSISQNKGMRKSYDDASLGRLRTRIAYKAESAGRRIILVDPRDTSQICSECGAYVHKDLSVRVHICPQCGLSIDRDINAALNILHRGLTRKPVPV